MQRWTWLHLKLQHNGQDGALIDSHERHARILSQADLLHFSVFTPPM